jgi:dCMP deaminase
LTEAIVSPDRIISTDQFDKEVISLATKAAEKSSDWWRQVGAAIVKDKRILLLGCNKHVPSDLSMDVYGDPRSSFDAGIRFDLSTAIHGEASLIARAAREGISLNGTSIYATTFPCPGCAKLIVEAGINKVYYAKGYSLLDAENVLKSGNVEIVMVKTD